MLNSVNSHYLRQVINLSEVMEVAATEDIVAHDGTRLLEKGGRVSRDVQERLVLRPLRKPLEASIIVDGGITTKVLVAEAARLSETSAPLRRILRATSGGASPLRLMADVRLGNAMSMMLTITERGGARALEHCVMVSLIAICLAKKLGLDEDAQRTVALAGILHDIGELYIEPGYLNPHRRLLPHEWKHIVAHPHIGRTLIDGLAEYPAAVSRAVAEHHERYDGSGYSSQLQGDALSVPGQILAVAEMISGVFTKSRPLDRAELALKIIPGEFSRDLLAAISGTLRLPDDEEAAGEPLDGFDDGAEDRGGQDVQALYARINRAVRAGEKLQEMLVTTPARALLALAMRRTDTIRRAFISTGLDAYLERGHDFLQMRCQELLFEKNVATREIAWRLRDVARDLALHSTALEPRDGSLLAPLIELLDGQR